MLIIDDSRRQPAVHRQLVAFIPRSDVGRQRPEVKVLRTNQNPKNVSLNQKVGNHFCFEIRQC